MGRGNPLWLPLSRRNPASIPERRSDRRIVRNIRRDHDIRAAEKGNHRGGAPTEGVVFRERVFFRSVAIYGDVRATGLPRDDVPFVEFSETNDQEVMTRTWVEDGISSGGWCCSFRP